jgi:hypothetical protein
MLKFCRKRHLQLRCEQLITVSDGNQSVFVLDHLGTTCEFSNASSDSATRGPGALKTAARSGLARRPTSATITQSRRSCVAVRNSLLVQFADRFVVAVMPP